MPRSHIRELNTTEMSSDRQISMLPDASLSPNSLTATSLFSIAHSRIIHQTIELETLIVNLDSGIYYSLEDVASVVWQFALAHQTPEQIVRWVHEKYAQPVELSGDISNFLSQLITEGLLKITNEEDQPKSSTSNIREIVSELPAKYKKPLVTCYVDLQELLLADPIHELMDAT